MAGCPSAAGRMAQTWDDVAFAHWRVDRDERPRARARLGSSSRRSTAPPGSGSPRSCLTGLRVRGLPPLPGVSTFPELNVRTYVTRRRRSPASGSSALDASSTLAVEAAQRALPAARTSARGCRYAAGEWTSSSARDRRARARRSAAATAAERRRCSTRSPARSRSSSPSATASTPTDGGRLYRAEIHHAPWDLQRGEARDRPRHDRAARARRRRAARATSRRGRTSSSGRSPIAAAYAPR